MTCSECKGARVVDRNTTITVGGHEVEADIPFPCPVCRFCIACDAPLENNDHRDPDFDGWLCDSCAE